MALQLRPIPQFDLAPRGGYASPDLSQLGDAFFGGFNQARERTLKDLELQAINETANAYLAGAGGTAAPAGTTLANLGQNVPSYNTSGKTPTFAGIHGAGNAIAGIESGGRYDSLGPIVKNGDRAYGKYQVMGSNIGPWTRQYVGREMTPQEFLASPEAQEAVFKGEFGRLAAKHGPEGAARAWFAGEGGMNDMNRRDILGTSVADYDRKFRAATGGAADAPAPGAQPAQFQIPPGQAAAPSANVTAPQLPIPPQLQAGLRSANPYVRQWAVQQLQQLQAAQQKMAIKAWELNQTQNFQRQQSQDQRDFERPFKQGELDIKTRKQDWAESQPIHVGDSLVDRQTFQPVFQAAPTVQRFKRPDGSEIGMQYDTRTKSWIPVPLPQDASSDRDPTVTGEDFLQTLDPGRASQIKAIVEGRMPPPGGFAMRSPQIQALLRDVAQYEPGFDLTAWKSRNETRTSFAKGKMAENIQAMNTVIGHMDDLLHKADALNNSRHPLWNRVANTYLDATGDPRVKEFQLARNAVADEMAKVFRQSGMSDTEIKQWKDTINEANSPAQLHGVINTGIGLMESRLNAVGDQYSRGMGKQIDPSILLSPKAQQTLTRLRSVTGGGRPAPAGEAGQGAPQERQPQMQPREVTTQEEYQALPSGTTYVAPDGSVRTKR